GAGEDRTQRFGLLVVGALIDVGGDRPVSVGHSPGRMDCEHHVQTVERGVAIPASVDVDDQRHVAYALGRSRGQRRGRRYEAGTYDAATAVLEIVAREMPLNLVCHRFLLPARSRTRCARMTCAGRQFIPFTMWPEGGFGTRRLHLTAVERMGSPRSDPEARAE